MRWSKVAVRAQSWQMWLTKFSASCFWLNQSCAASPCSKGRQILPMFCTRPFRGNTWRDATEAIPIIFIGHCRQKYFAKLLPLPPCPGPGCCAKQAASSRLCWKSWLCRPHPDGSDGCCWGQRSFSLCINWWGNETLGADLWRKADVHPCEITEVVSYSALHPIYCSFTTCSLY